MEHAVTEGRVTVGPGVRQGGVTTPYRVLLIEDSPSDAGLINRTLQDDPLGSRFLVTTCVSLSDGLRTSKHGEFDIVLLDLNLPDSRGFETFEKTVRQASQLPVVILTSSGGEELALRAVEQGAQDFVFKDRLDPYWVTHTIRHAVGRHRLLQRVKVAEAREIEAANGANQAKTDFLAAMSHEIRSPIGAILMASNILLDESPGADERREFTEIVRRNGEHLLALVNDILDLSKVEAGCLTIEEIPAAPREIIEDVLATFRGAAASKNLTLVADYGPNFPDSMSCDPTRLRQILTNLVGNAIKFTDQGNVTIRAANRLSEGGPRELVVAVEDSGIGIHADHVKGLFRRFSQADASIPRKHGGTGLGLALSRRLATALGGRLELTRSQPGVGSTFTMCLPLKTCAEIQNPMPETTRSEPRSAPLVGVGILLVEDNPDNQYLYGGILERAGAAISLAGDGVEGLEKALQQKHDVIIMDMQMPKMDGPTTVRKLRALGYRRPILAMTANALGFGHDRCLEAGCNGYLLKPVTTAALIDAVQKHAPH